MNETEESFLAYIRERIPVLTEQELFQSMVDDEQCEPQGDTCVPTGSTSAR